MNTELLEEYGKIRSGGVGYYEQDRGLIAVWGKEAVQFLDGLISNDMKTIEDGSEMLAAFPNVQGRLLAVVRVLKQGDRFLFETEEATREKVFNNLFRFTYAGDFFVEDLSEQFRYFETYGNAPIHVQGGVVYRSGNSIGHFVPVDAVDRFRSEFGTNAANISDELYEVLRIESGIPKYGVDMGETTIVPELGLDGLISYNKGCYIGQEIIARIHFRGHVAKRLTGLVLSEPISQNADASEALDLKSPDGKNAGRITSVTFSPKLEKTIALAFVRYDYLAAGTELLYGDITAVVTELPFLN